MGDPKEEVRQIEATRDIISKMFGDMVGPEQKQDLEVKVQTGLDALGIGTTEGLLAAVQCQQAAQEFVIAWAAYDSPDRSKLWNESVKDLYFEAGEQQHRQEYEEATKTIRRAIELL